MWELAQRFWEICYAYLRHCLRTSVTQRRLKNVVCTERWPPLFFSLIQHNFMLTWMREDIYCFYLFFNEKYLHIWHSWGFGHMKPIWYWRQCRLHFILMFLHTRLAFKIELIQCQLLVYEFAFCIWHIIMANSNGKLNHQGHVCMLL